MTQKGTEWTARFLGFPFLQREFSESVFLLRHLRFFAAKLLGIKTGRPRRR